MFRKLFAFLDGIGDRLNPVTMLLARQSMIPESRGIGTLLFFVTAWVVSLLICVFRAPAEGFIKEMFGGPSGGEHVMPSLVVNMYSLILAFSMIGCPAGWRILIQRDPTLELTPLSGRDTLAGAWRYGIWTAACLVGLVAPIFVTLHGLQLFSTDGAIFYPTVTCLLGLVYFHLYLPFIAAIQTRLEAWFVYGLGITAAIVIYFGGVIPIIGPLMLPPGLATLAERRCWLSVLVTAVVGSYFLAWRLVDFNLARHRSFSWKIGVTMAVSVLWIAVLLGLWFGLWWWLG